MDVASPQSARTDGRSSLARSEAANVASNTLATKFFAWLDGAWYRGPLGPDHPSAPGEGHRP